MVVCDSSPLIYLSKIGQVELLKALFGSVLIPKSVYRETIVEAKALRKPSVAALEKAIEDGWIKVVDLAPVEAEFVKKLALQESIEVEDAEVVFSAKKHGGGLVTNDRWFVKVAVGKCFLGNYACVVGCEQECVKQRLGQGYTAQVGAFRGVFAD